MDSWFNGTYKNRLVPTVQMMVGSTTFYYTPGNGDTKRSTLSRGIFALSMTELGETYGSFNKNEGSALPIAAVLQFDRTTPQWTRTPWNDPDRTDLAFMQPANGDYPDYLCSKSYGYRPCFTLLSTALATEELELVEE